MRIFMSVDLEGISGVCLEAQTTRGTAAYEHARSLMRSDVEAAVAGCLAADATEVLIADAHDKGSNLTIEGLPEQAILASGSPAPLSMMHGADGGFDAAVLIGYHAMAGTTAAVLDHTYTYDVFRVRIDEYLEVGEVGINAALAGVYGVPVVFVSGDDKVAAEAGELLPGVRTGVVKQGSMRTAARMLAPAAAQAVIRNGVEQALRDRSTWPAPLDWSERSMRVTFTRTGACDVATLCPAVRRVDARTIEIPGGDYRRVFDAFLTSVVLALTTRE